ncbi:MAG: carbamoyl-phosphate synthase large subunit [Spirochaetales bacterium]|nr:carbamoyl-phosphate synthase large subunit [Spirochaetales bacterium]
MPARKDIHKILIIGSGPIVIGQACEFDYSGNQAVKALKEEGYQVVLVNPNPATIMTTPGVADAIYMDPLEVPYLEAIIAAERPDCLLPTMGGQTALNAALALGKAGVLEKYNLEVLGASLPSIELAEDRGKFKELMGQIGLESPRSVLANSYEEAMGFAKAQGVPLIIRPSFTLGGRGGGIVNSWEEVSPMIKRALSESPTHQLLIEESLVGWKEFEMEVMRDKADNAVIICSIENVDPMGVHTGDSITVAPIQTLSDGEYQKMRTASIEILRAVGVDCGGSNVQFAYNPQDGRMVVIEMNPRVSRSSALASKATGFPIARSSARLAVGFTLDEIINDITGKTVSCFEPSLDYVAVKVPRFELEKFPRGYNELGTQMKSVGESLALGRTYNEALNKAIRAAEFGFHGLEDLELFSNKEIEGMLRKLHPRRIFAAYTAIKRGGFEAIGPVSEMTGYDPWFLYNMYEQAELEKRIQQEDLTEELLLEVKRMGISDKRIARLKTGPESMAAFLSHRQKWTDTSIADLRDTMNIRAGYHFVDTCSGEFEAETPYFYSTYGEINEAIPMEGKKVVILGSGPNRIGQGLEFDTCCTLSSLAYRRLGVRTALINSNPETVSTDFNISDRLYLEPLTFEDVKEVLLSEGARDVIVQLGGQTPLNMAEELEAFGANIIGTSVQSIRGAEDRRLFSDLMKKTGLRQPENRSAGNMNQVQAFAEEIGYPVLLRPSFVLGGKSMAVVFNSQELLAYVSRTDVEISDDKPILVDQFLEDAFEYDVDALCDGTNVYVGGIMQHIEAAGVHSGDSACVFPAYSTSGKMNEAMIRATAAIGLEVGVNGFLNIQFAVKDNELYVLEVNPRASRTVPFISKASGVDLVDAAVKVWEGIDLKSQGLIDEKVSRCKSVGLGQSIVGWAVKEAMFSFDRFRDTDPLLGPEMKSTGEVIGIGASFGEAFSKASAATGTLLPTRGSVFVSVNDYDKDRIVPIVKELVDMGFEIKATRGTAEYLFGKGILAEVILKYHEGHPNIVDHLQAGKIDLVINTPMGRYTQKDDGYLRIETMRNKIPYTTTTSAALAAVEGIKYLRTGEVVPRALPSLSTS